MSDGVAYRRVSIAALLLVGAAHADPLRPVTGRLGWQVDLDSFVQVDGVPWAEASANQISPSTSEPENQETMEIRRGLLRVRAHKDELTGELELDANTVGGPNARVLTAKVGWAMPGAVPLVSVDAGLMLIPFGVEVPTNVRYRTFMEQPTFLRALFPGDNDVGVVARGGWGIARWSLAAMNGAPIKDAQWKGADPSSSYDLIARVGGDLSIRTVPGRPHFVFGVSALTGSSIHPGTPPTKDTIEWVDENHDGIIQITEIHDVPGRPGEPSQAFKHDALGADASAEWCLRELGAGKAFFEGAISTNLDRGVYYADPIATSRDLRELGFAAGVVQSLTEHGLAGVRYDRYNADRDASQQAGISLVGVDRVFDTWAFLAAGIWHTSRLSFEYDHVRNPFGLSDSGMPTTRADDRFVVRAQAEF